MRFSDYYYYKMPKKQKNIKMTAVQWAAVAVIMSLKMKRKKNEIIENDN